MFDVLAAKAAGPLAAGLGKGIGDALGGGGPFVGGSAQSGAYGTNLTKAGAVYNFGAGNDTSTATTTSTPTPQALGVGLYDSTPMQAGMSPWALLALGLVAFGIYRAKG